ncbi:MAG: methionyl-tRNA formyltransferase [Spirochaetia bacterium]|nr:methionyl-tRNA formyltransferase [Spirochaetia bacterium]
MNLEKIKISYWGSPFISAKFLETLLQDGSFEISFVVTQPDKPRSKRGREVLPCAVKKLADKNSIPVYSPVSLKKNTPDLLEEFNKHDVLFHVVFAYGKLIPEAIFNAPLLKTLNFHASLLPLLRGAAPIEYALLEGHRKTGWSIQAIVEKMDAGDVFYQNEIEVSVNETKNSLTEKMLESLVSFGPDILKKYAAGKLNSRKQDEEKATYCGKIKTEAGKIDFSKTHIEIRNQYRAFGENPGLYSYFNGKKIKIDFDLISLSKKLSDQEKEMKSGRVFLIEKEKTYILCGDGFALPAVLFQPEGKRKMSAVDFVNGYRLKEGDYFG